MNHTDGAKKELKNIFSGDKAPFQTPKPSQLIERVIQLSTKKDSIVLDSFAGSGTTAHATLNLNKIDAGKRKFICIEMEDYAESITAERIRRVINGYGDKGATNGEFDYYILGAPLFNGENSEYLNVEVGIEKIREYIWYSETRTPFSAYSKTKDNSYYLGRKEDTAYYFIYENDALTTLDYDTLATIKTKAGQYVIYADNCLLPKEFLLQKNIIFKKIPRDITRF